MGSIYGQISWIGKLSVLALFIMSGGISSNRQAVWEAQNDRGILDVGVSNLSLSISTYMGGSANDVIRDVTADGNGNIYLTGGTQSANFTTTAGAFDTTHNGSMDVFVMKLNANGVLVWSTFIGGPNYDRAYAIEVDSQGYVYVGGRAGDGYPTTSGVVQPGFAGDVDVNPLYGAQDGFVTKLSPNGSQVIWSTYFGDNGRSFIRDIDIDSANRVHLALTDVSTPNPHITPGAFQTSLQGGYDGVVAKLSANATQVLWATYLGGSGQYDLGTPSIQLDSSGNVFVLGGTFSADIATTPGAYDRTLGGNNDLHLAKFSPNGAFLFGTYLGGSAAEWTETHGLALDPQGNAVIAATTMSSDFPTTSSAFDRTYNGSGGPGTGGNTNYAGDLFVAKISSNGSQLLASTFVGGRYGEGAEGVSVDAQGNIHISGATYSDNFPTTGDALQRTYRGNGDFLAVKLSADLSQVLYATYLGGNDTDYSRTAYVRADGTFYVAGETFSSNWPILNAPQTHYGGNGDGALARFATTSTGNQAPDIPHAPVPADRASNVLTAQSLSWQGGDPDGDIVTYTVAFGPGNPPPVVGTTTLNRYTPALVTDTTYYWRITASDGLSTSVSPTWSFTTATVVYSCYLPALLRY